MPSAWGRLRLCRGGRTVGVVQEKLKERFEIKSTTVCMDQSAGEVRESRIPNRVIRVTEEGWEYEAEQRHADLIVKETGAYKLSALTH